MIIRPASFVRVAVVLSAFGIGAPPALAQERAGPQFTIDAGVASLFDSNVNRRPAALSAHGVGGELLVRLATGASRPLFVLEYAPAFRTSSERTPYDGAGHRLHATLRLPLARVARFDVMGRASRGGVDEDLNRADEMMVLGRAEFALSRGTRLRLYGAHRWRELGAAALPALGAYTGAEARQRIGSSTTLLAEWRYEQLVPEDSTRVWKRHSVGGGIEQRLTRAITAEADVRRRWRHYPNRLVDESTYILRQDRDWRVGAGLVFEYVPGTQLRLEYELERRSSTDVDRTYDAHRFGVTLRQRVVTFGRRRVTIRSEP